MDSNKLKHNKAFRLQPTNLAAYSLPSNLDLQVQTLMKLDSKINNQPKIKMVETVA
jgi:hypothetical protein